MTAIQILEQLQLASLRKVDESLDISFDPDYYNQRKRVDKIIKSLRERKNNDEETNNHYKKLAEAFPEEYGSDTESYVSYFENLLSEMPTGFQDPINYDNMKKILNKVLEIYNSNFAKDKTLNLPVFGSTQTGAFSSFIVPTEKIDEPLLVYSDAFFHFSHLITKIIAMTITDVEVTDRGTVSYNYGNSLNSVRNDKKLQMRFLDLMFAQIIHGEPFEAEPIGEDISFAQRQISMRMDEILIAFIITHEFSHFSNGDLELVENKAKNNATIFAKQQEMQADELAVKLVNMFASQENYRVDDISTTLNTNIAILCAFCSLNLIENSERLKSGYSTLIYPKITTPQLMTELKAYLKCTLTNRNVN